MMNFITKLLFLFTLMTGTLITLSSSSWIGMWMGLELNLLSFIPLMVNNNLNSTESAIKYFLVQAFASLIFLFSSMIYMIKSSYMFPIHFTPENMIINSAMLLKLGTAPFHFWFPNIIEGMSWLNSLILLTWQKIAPLTIISYSYFNTMIYMFIIISVVTGSIGGLNQTSIRKLMAFSSINHIGWMLTAMLYSNLLWMFYFLIYSLINMSIIMMFKIFNMYYLNQIFLFNNKNLILKFCLFVNLLSLGGLPPFLGFLPKWMIIENLTMMKSFLLMFIMVMSALITLFFYTRLSFSAFLLSYPSANWKIFQMSKYKFMNMISIFNLSVNFMLVMIMMNNFMS